MCNMHTQIKFQLVNNTVLEFATGDNDIDGFACAKEMLYYDFS